MRHLISTTAVAALLALPVAAQQTTTGQGTEQQQVQPTEQTQMQQGQMAQAGMMEVEASELIGKRLYIQRDGVQAPGMQGRDGQVMQDAEEQAGQQPLEGQQDQTAQTGQAGEQPLEGQQDQQGEVAQTDQQQVQPGEQDQMAQTGQTGMESGQAGQQPMTGQQGMSGQQMAGMDQGVTDPREQWQTAGRIDDVLISEDGQVQALVIDAGGFLGGGQGDLQVDIQEVQFVPHAKDQNEFFVVYSGDRAMLEQAQPFDEAALQPGQQRGTAVWGDEMRGQQAEVSASAITTEELVGASIYGPNDDWVGDVSELAMTEDGQIEAVIVDVGGFLGIGTRSVALSLEEVQLRQGEGGWFGNEIRGYVNATQEELEQLPEWEQPG